MHHLNVALEYDANITNEALEPTIRCSPICALLTHRWQTVTCTLLEGVGPPQSSWAASVLVGIYSCISICIHYAGLLFIFRVVIYFVTCLYNMNNNVLYTAVDVWDLMVGVFSFPGLSVAGRREPAWTPAAWITYWAAERGNLICNITAFILLC